MKTSSLIVLSFILARVMGQSDPNPVFNIYNADELMNIAKTKGIHELERDINPIDLVYIDTSYATKLIDLEFKIGFWEKQYNGREITTYGLPSITMEFADNFNNSKAGKMLFDYYCLLPKIIKSDTIYNIYNHLDEYLKIMIKYNSTPLKERLIKDYDEWSNLAKKTPRKIYPTIDELRNLSIEDSLVYKTNNLYVDCNFIVLQIAGALDYLKVNGFNDSLLQIIKRKQTYPFANSYTFPKPYGKGLKSNYISRKTIENTTLITNFKTDYKKIEKKLLENFESCCDSKLFEIIEQGANAYIIMSHNNGYDYYKVILKPDNKIVITYLSSVNK